MYTRFSSYICNAKDCTLDLPWVVSCREVNDVRMMAVVFSSPSFELRSPTSWLAEALVDIFCSECFSISFSIRSIPFLSFRSLIDFSGFPGIIIGGGSLCPSSFLLESDDAELETGLSITHGCGGSLRTFPEIYPSTIKGNF